MREYFVKLSLTSASISFCFLSHASNVMFIFINQILYNPCTHKRIDNKYRQLDKYIKCSQNFKKWFWINFLNHLFPRLLCKLCNVLSFMLLKNFETQVSLFLQTTTSQPKSIKVTWSKKTCFSNFTSDWCNSPANFQSWLLPAEHAAFFQVVCCCKQ